MKVLLRTFISPVIIGADLGPNAGEQLETKPGHPVCWLDCLLDGGIRIPEGVIEKGEPPLLWLISGPHGAGKTLLAMELCYRLASQLQPPTERTGHLNATSEHKTAQPTGKRCYTTFYSNESSSGRIRENMQSFGWDLDQATTMNIFGSELLAQRGDDPGTMFKELVSDLDFEAKHDAKGVVAAFDGLSPYFSAERLDRLLECCAGRVWIVILILDPRTSELDHSFKNRANILMQFSESNSQGYNLRYLRIVKMGFQEHVKGDHVVKIYGKPLLPSQLADVRMPAGDHIGLDRLEGGTFVLPSIHRHLSGGMRNTARTDIAIEAPVDGLSKILPLGTPGNREGFPKGRCTAFVGDRGGLKSYLAYFTLLQHLRKSNTLGIMLSLRDDREAALNSLETICEIEGIQFGPGRTVKGLASGKHRRIDIVFFWPGYIPPAEFMHRVVVATEAMLQFNPGYKSEDLMVVLNGLDHLNARHPLCAREEMFVPALVSYFRQHNSSLFVVAATDRSLPLIELEPMADCLLRFNFARRIPESLLAKGSQFVDLFAQRVPSGGIGGGQGLLYRATKENQGKRVGHLIFDPTFYGNS